MITELSELDMPLWASRRGVQPPAYLVASIPAWQIALVLAIPAAVMLIVALMTSWAMVLAVLGVSVAGIPLAAWMGSRSRVVAGPDWVATENFFGHRIVKLAELRRADVFFSSGRATYLRLHDAEGGFVALNVRTQLPRLREMVARYALASGIGIDDRVARVLRLGLE